jgi:ABC-2 type transport system ATP-binding protein
MIDIHDLHMKFTTGFIPKPVHALRGVSLHVDRGEIFGFLGPNGAGKTTTIKLLLHLLKPTGGHASINGIPIDQPTARASVGYLPDQPYFYDYLTGMEFLCYCAELSGILAGRRKTRANECLQLVGLDVDPKLQLRKYSRGMLQRIGMAQALLHDPKLLILDEPMTGLDPVGRREFHDLILQLKDAGRTIFFSSHIIQDVETLCDRVSILIGGKLTAIGPVESIVPQHIQCSDITAKFTTAEQAAQAQLTLSGAEIFGQNLRIRVDHPDDVTARIQQLTTAGGTVLSVVPHRNSLEDLFLHQVQAEQDATPCA